MLNHMGSALEFQKHKTAPISDTDFVSVALTFFDARNYYQQIQLWLYINKRQPVEIIDVEINETKPLRPGPNFWSRVRRQGPNISVYLRLHL